MHVYGHGDGDIRVRSPTHTDMADERVARSVRRRNPLRVVGVGCLVGGLLHEKQWWISGFVRRAA